MATSEGLPCPELPRCTIANSQFVYTAPSHFPRLQSCDTDICTEIGIPIPIHLCTALQDD